MRMSRVKWEEKLRDVGQPCENFVGSVDTRTHITLALYFVKI